jgi:hypothetical protein
MKKWQIALIIAAFIVLLGGIYWTAWEDMTKGIPRDQHTGEFKWN